jgi:hypothetical protein
MHEDLLTTVILYRKFKNTSSIPMDHLITTQIEKEVSSYFLMVSLQYDLMLMEMETTMIQRNETIVHTTGQEFKLMLLRQDELSYIRLRLIRLMRGLRLCLVSHHPNSSTKLGIHKQNSVLQLEIELLVEELMQTNNEVNLPKQRMVLLCLTGKLIYEYK